MDTLKSKEIFEQAQKYIPGGVNSPVRAFKSVGGTPVFMKRGQGAYMFDVNDNQYIDYINSWGPMILGHAHPIVVEAVRNQANESFTFGTPTKSEVDIAKLVVESIPFIDKIRFVNSGTEACMSAVRLARGCTGRDKIIKFKGCYHGHAESFLVAAGSGALTFGVPNSPGVPKSFAQQTLLADYNNADQVEQLFKDYKDEIAAVILEPVAGNMGCILPMEGFLKSVEEIAKLNGALFIVDEVMTGFRLAWGGACELFDLDPDIVCYGKVIGGGMPVGAFAGKEIYFDQLAPMGPVYQAGTLSGNPIAVAAGLNTLRLIKSNPEFYKDLNEKTSLFANRIRAAFEEKNIRITINQIGSMMSLFFSDAPINNLEDVQNSGTHNFAAFFHYCLEHGIYLPPSAFESWFISDAIGPKEIERTLAVMTNFLRK